MHSTLLTTLRRPSLLHLGALSLAGVVLAGCGDLPSDLTARQSDLRPIGSDPIVQPPRPSPPPVVTPPPPAPTAPDYTFTTLPFFPGGINDNGVIAGAFNGNIVTWSNGALTAILPLPADLSSAVATGGAINNAGSVIGQAGNRGFVWLRPLPPDCATTDCMLPIEILSTTGYGVTPTAINNANVVVGSFTVPSPHPVLYPAQLHAFQWSPTGGFQDITPSPWASAVATDINDAGEIGGYGVLSVLASPRAPLRWSAVAGRPLLAELADTGEANAISNTGRTAGFANGAPVIWSVPTAPGPGGVQASPIAGPGATSIDDLAATARVVGVAGLGTAHPNKPWTTHAGTLDFLPVPADGPNTISDVFSSLHVNACGSIVGTEMLEFRAGNDTVIDPQGFVWTKPTCDPAPPAIFNLPPGTVTATGTISIR